MKLYSVQIPYTWYTINNDFGSNYFFLKGNSPGIDNGQHDVKVQIRSGTYNPVQIATAINSSIAALKSKDTTDPQYNSIYDLSFGQTYISYNTDSAQDSKIVFEFDLKKTFNETDYSLYFPNWTTPNIEGGAKSNSIPSFLGYNYNTYLPYIAYSNASTNFVLTNIFDITSSNNTISIIQYSSQSTYSANNSDRIIHNTTNIILSNGGYNRGSLITAINSAIITSSNLDRVYSFFKLTDITNPANINYGKKRIELATKLNRATTKQITGSKLAIIFPDESSITINNRIWVGNTSCFRFPSNTIELNNIVSETPTSITNYSIGNNVGVLLTCVKPGYNIQLNTFNTQIPSGDYILNDYINKINDAFKLWEDGQNNAVNVVDASLTLIDSSPKVGFNILKKFTEVDYNIVLSASVFNFGQILGFDTSYNSNYMPTSNIGSFSTLAINGNNCKIILQPKNNLSVGNYLAAPIEVLLTQTDPLDINQLFSSINTDFANSEYMKGSNISYVQNISTGGLTLTLILIVSVKLTSNDYKASFIDADGNSWDNFGISSVPYDLLLNNPVIGTKSIFNNLITISTLNNNNQIIFRPVNPVLTGGNDIIFEIPSLTYTRIQLIEKINTLFYQNPITRNSTITIDDNNISTVKMSINKTYTSADFRLVFYDIFSFVYCNVGVSNVRNVKWDTTLGWILGFHTYTEYNLSEFARLGIGKISSDILKEEYQNYYNNIYGRITESNSSTAKGDITNTVIYEQASYTNSNSRDGRLAIIGDSVCNTNLYNYFLLIIDDFIQNHVNDGLITISSVENDIALPTNASRISYQCDPITGQKIAGISTNNQFTSLTAKQLYSMNQIIEARRSSSTYTAGPYMRDVFGLIPIKLAGLTFGSTYMEFGGTLQNQNRKYFGPVNIKKLSIKLMNDRGDVVDLNGTNWSFTLICEILITAT